MKLNKFLIGTASLIAFSGILTACSDDDDPKWNDDGTKVELPARRVYLLNEGTQNMNNANLALFDPAKNTLTKDIFYTQNGMMLGEIGQDMIEYNDYIYVSVYGSNYIAKLNAAAVEVGRVSFASDPDLQGKVRYLAAEDGYIYASFYGGIVAKINANTLKVESKLSGLGTNLEGVAIEDDCLYVANSYTKTDAGYDYHEELAVVDLRTFTKKGTVTVSANPNQLAEEDDKIFLISWGNYRDKSYEFQMIDPRQNNKVQTIATATMMGVGDDMVYLVNSETDYSNWPETVTNNTFFSYNIKTGQLNNSSFVKDPEGRLDHISIYMISVDDETGDIYVGSTNYSTSNGKLFRISRDGTIVAEVDCGGQNPRRAVFFD